MGNLKKSENDGGSGVSRRQFLTTMGAGAAAAAVSGSLQKISASADKGIAPSSEMTRIVLNVNGRNCRVLVEPRWSLLFVLREKLGFTATKMGCDRGECGACTVLIDGVARYACMTLAVEAEGNEITTLEGLMQGEELGPVQEAFREEDAFQCGYCTPGQIMAAEGLLRKNPAPNDADIRKGMSGNICRCGAYPHIFSAVKRAAEKKAGPGRRG